MGTAILTEGFVSKLLIKAVQVGNNLLMRKFKPNGPIPQTKNANKPMAVLTVSQICNTSVPIQKVSPHLKGKL